MEDRTFYRKTSRKPCATKGAYEGVCSYATHACIIQENDGLYVVNVWDLRPNSNWHETSDSQLHHFTRLQTLEEAKKWLIESYGGKWVKE